MKWESPYKLLLIRDITWHYGNSTSHSKLSEFGNSAIFEVSEKKMAAFGVKRARKPGRY